jgi:hypothetical protein
MGGLFNTPAVSQLAASDFGPGQPNDVQVHHGGQMVVIAHNGDAAFKVPKLISPPASAVAVIIHGKPGRFGIDADCEAEIPAAVVAQLLEDAGIQRGTPLRCITCHGGEKPDPAIGVVSAAQQMATAWNGPVSAPNGFCRVTVGTIRIDLGDFVPSVGGGQQFEVFCDAQQNPIGEGQGSFVLFTP